MTVIRRKPEGVPSACIPIGVDGLRRTLASPIQPMENYAHCDKDDGLSGFPVLFSLTHLFRSLELRTGAATGNLYAEGAKLFHSLGVDVAGNFRGLQLSPFFAVCRLHLL